MIRYENLTEMSGFCSLIFFVSVHCSVGFSITEICGVVQRYISWFHLLMGICSS